MGRTRQHVLLDDPTQRLTGVFLTQLLPFFDPKTITLFRAYEAAVYQAL